ncbi:SARP family transcriptional regulator [Sphaerisporangium krabiense]|uniref:Putative ATPase/DNA-binding SARP family transcriptional activator n=1 Tax=Sphaerisporangium krabiense TaxID=763782 RepID=A0A7W8Z0V7_9ACTN|nr:BTAD domain-containing putative transcriptional regulator [Sphaerisporangium krabiense]MBB5625277.1 putative ATPase/DNA-binding SARP family transcriptional activator [Sphaerisporangium krabiense]GII64207.1 SARP family transcriptional regulator [Sphaerisporangium krabiense]
MHFGLLGPTEVLRDGRHVPVGGPMVRALLALLLLDAGRVVGVARLIDGLYGESAPSANALQSQVSRLRRILGDGLVESHPLGYRLAVAPGDVDVHRFTELARQGHEALAAGDAGTAAAVLREALGLWRGAALADVGGAPFASVQVTRLTELRVTATEDRVEADLALGAHHTLVAELRDLVAAHPLRERLWGQLMRALSACGRQAEALAAFAEARRTLADELGADPSPELAALHVRLLRGEQTADREKSDVPSAVAPGPRTALPAALTGFVGREEELARVRELIGRERLVTLSGPGGTGKTRLAVEAARQVAAAGGEVGFVELAPLGDGAEAPQAVLAALGLREGGLRPPSPADAQARTATDRLVTALAGRETLLVLDNCEHVLDEVAALAGHLLARCPGLRVLATSREALGVLGETIHPVPQLGLPPADATAEEAGAYPAVRLFAERARAVRPGFRLEEAGAGEVARICRVLDGLPLAIELAAARLRSLTVEEVAARLDDRFGLLTRGNRAAQPRHRTLRAVVEWSWDLLDEDERTLARRLTVFSGGATVAAADRVCGPGTVDLLASLADKSLVELVHGRYRMLETIRAFCAERLAEAGEEKALRSAHLAYYLDLAETAEPFLRDGAQLTWLERLDAERGDLHAAVRWAAEAGEHAAAVRLVAALSPYWLLRGRRSEGGKAAAEVLAATGAAAPHGLEEEYVLCVLDAAATGAADKAALETAEALMAGRPVVRPFLTLLWGSFSGMSTGTADPRDAADPWARALTHLGLGYRSWWAEGDLAEADRTFSLALAGFRGVGERWGMATALGALAVLADLRGDAERSAALADEALELTGVLGATEDMAELLHRRADAGLRRGDLDAARGDYERGIDLGRRAGMPDALARGHHGLAEVARLRGDVAEARRLCHEALAECPAGWITTEQTRARVSVTLARLAVAEGETAQAKGWLRRALSGGAATQDLGVAALAVWTFAEVALTDHEDEKAARLLGAHAALRGEPPDPALAARCRSRLGDAAYERAYESGRRMSPEETLAILSPA